MRLLVFGTGAIGGLIGGKLAAAGHHVVCLARPRIAEAIRARGLTIAGKGVPTVARPQAVTSLAGAFAGRTYDVVVFAIRSYDTAAAIEQLRAAAPAPPPILCVQNGVDNEPLISGAFGAAWAASPSAPAEARRKSSPGVAHAIPGAVTTAVSMDAPGVITIERERGIGLALGHPLAPQIAAALEGAGFHVVKYPAPEAASLKWSKLLTNLIANATTAITDLPPAEVYAHPGLYRLEVAMLRECLAVMRAKGLRLVDLPRLEVMPFGLILRFLPAALYQGILRSQVVSGRGSKMPSFHIALSSGQQRTEVEWLHGAVARHGVQVGVRTPVCQLLTETLVGIAAGKLRWGDFRGQPEALLRRLQ